MARDRTATSQTESPFSLNVTSYRDVYQATPMQRIRLLKIGLNARDAKTILASLDIPQRRTLQAVNIARAKLVRMARLNATLPAAEGERVLGVAKLVGQVQLMIEESGEPGSFNAPAWLSHWLVEPLPALDGVSPIELLDTMEGQGVIATLLNQMQSGTYA